MAQLALMIDLERCTGCKSCEAACKQTHALGPHTYRNRVMWFNEQNTQQAEAVPDGALHFLTVTCQQCERPACLRACPVYPKAICKNPDTGVVSVDESRCTGCGECAVSCPYGAIGYNGEHHHAVKCDLCANRRKQGGGPACASVCPTRAIAFGERETLLLQAEQEQRELLEHDHFLQKPATIYLQRIKPQTRPNTAIHATPALMADHQVRSNLGYELTFRTYDNAYRQTSDQQQEQIVPGGCNICFNGCPVKYHLRNGEVVNIYGNDEDPVFQGRICPKSQMLLQMYGNPDRLQQPLKRVGERGEGKFEPVGWGEALDDIAARLGRIREESGAEAVAIQAGSRTGVLNLMGAIPLFAQLWGTPNVASTEPFCDLAKGVALEMTQGSIMMGNVYTEKDIGSAELYVYIGDNQAETRPVNFGMLNDWRLKNGAQMIVVDPRLTATASKADQWLAIRPGTDLALGLALVHHIFEQEWHDAEFCQDWILGWQEWCDFIMERDYSPEWASPLTDIPVDTIKLLAQRIAHADGCMLFLSRGVNQHSNAAQTNRTFMFLAAITGNWGRKGGGYFNVASEPDWRLPQIPVERRPKCRPAISKNPAGWLDAMLGDEVYPIRALITGNNPVGQWPDQNKTRRAVSKLDLLVHMELFKSETSQYADYVLPMASGVEKGGTTRFAEDRRIVWNDRLLDPPGEAKSDHWFWIELGKRFGFEDLLKEEYKEPRALWDEVVRQATPALNGIATQRLLKQTNRCVRIPAATEESVADETLYQPGSTAFGQEAGKRFPTASGKLEFWTKALDEELQQVGLTALPAFYSEVEQLQPMEHLIDTDRADSPVVSPFLPPETHTRPRTITKAGAQENTSTFDTELVTGRPPAPHFHSWTHYFWQAQEMWPELYCQIHPDKAQRLGIKDGERIKVETAYGELTARAWLHSGIRKTAVFIPIGWDEQQPFHPAASVNQLTRVSLDPVSQQANLKVHLCRVRKL